VSVLPWPATGYIQVHSGSVSAQKPPLLAVPYGGVLDGGTHLQASARLVADIEEQAVTSRKAGPVIREELTRLFTWEERHRRLAARLLIALGLTLLVLAVGSALIWVIFVVTSIAGSFASFQLRRLQLDQTAAVRWKRSGPQRSEVSGAGFG
jgi:hypothetical protein